MVIRMEQLLWEMFKKTGDIKYYLFIKRLGSEEIEDSKDKRNRDRGTSLQ